LDHIGLWNGKLNGREIFFIDLETLLNVPFLFFLLGMSPELELWTGTGIE
jgi:hypothetical protein